MYCIHYFAEIMNINLCDLFIYLAGTIMTLNSTCGLVAMTSAQHAEGRQFDPGQVYVCDFDGFDPSISLR